MAAKKATHVMVHRKQYLRVDGKLQHVPAGTEIALSDAQAEALEGKGRVMKIGQKNAVDVSEAEKADEAKERIKALKAEAKELGITGYSKWSEDQLNEAITKAKTESKDGE